MHTASHRVKNKQRFLGGQNKPTEYMESRKKRLGPSKFGVRYENQRVSWQSERRLASWFLIWVDILDYHEIQAFPWRLLREYLFQLLTCRLSNSYDVNLVKNYLDSWMKTTQTDKLTYPLDRLLLLKAWTPWHGLRDAMCGHVSFLLDPDWFWEDPGDFVTPWSDIRFEIIISEASHTFFPTRYLNLFFNQPIFFILTVQLRSEHLTANVFGMLLLYVVWLKRYSPCSWLTVYSFN